MMEQETELNPFDRLKQEIRKVIDDNSRFLARLTDDDYEPDEDIGDDDVQVEEL